MSLNLLKVTLEFSFSMFCGPQVLHASHLLHRLPTRKAWSLHLYYPLGSSQDEPFYTVHKEVNEQHTSQAPSIFT